MRLRRRYGLVLACLWTPVAACESGDPSDCSTVCYTLTRPEASACIVMVARSYWADNPADFKHSSGSENVTLNCRFYRSVLGDMLPRRLRAELDVLDKKSGTMRRLVGATIAGPAGCSTIEAGDREAQCCLRPAGPEAAE